MHRKKHPPSSQIKKHLATQYRKDFFQKMKLIIDSVCGIDIYPLIPREVLDDLYLSRSAPFTFKADINSNIPSIILKNSKAILTSIFKRHKLLIPPVNLEISLNDFYTVVLTIVILQTRINEITFSNADKVKKAIQIFINEATFEIANKSMYDILHAFNLGDSDLRKYLYWYSYKLVPPNTFPAQVENIIIISSIKSEEIKVELEGISRPAYRVGWAFAFSGPEWLCLKPSDLGFKSPFAEQPLKVYIQSHALNRLIERIDCFWPGTVQFNMYCSLLSPKITYDSSNNLLIEFSFFGHKAGYFRADIINEIILIRTFLFITNNGTPEGQLLEKNTGLLKADKKYLAIDKLSAFMNSDLDKNKEVQQLFINSGCQCLLDLFNKGKPLLTKTGKGFNSDLILSYLKKDNDNIADYDKFKTLFTS
jgi:hypothetical protein